MANRAIDIYILYQLVKRIATPFNKTEAFKLGLIDARGKRLKRARTGREKNAMTYLDRFIFNIKRALSKAGLDSKLVTYASALYLIKEFSNQDIPDDTMIVDGVITEAVELSEEMASGAMAGTPANHTGQAAPGTGSDPVHWGKIAAELRGKGRKIRQQGAFAAKHYVHKDRKKYNRKRDKQKSLRDY